MCYNSNYLKNQTCLCQSNFSHTTQFWSKKTKIRILENYLLYIEEQSKDIKDALEELKQ